MQKSFRKNKSKGFVLLFVMGSLILVVALFLGISLVSRDKVNQTSANRVVAASDYALKGVLQLVVAKLSVDLDLASPGNLVETGQYRLSPGYEPWMASMAPKQVVFEQDAFRVQVVDARWLPDANTIYPEEWVRLLIVVGMDKLQAETIAQRIVEKRDNLLNAFGGYQTFDQLFSGLAVSPTLLYGSGDDTAVGLIQLLSIGTGTRVTHPLYTPLAVYKALYNATDDQLKKLSDLRAKGPVSRQQESELFGLSGQPGLENSPPSLLKVLVAPESARSRVGSAGTVGFIVVNGTQVRLVSQYLFYRE